MLQYKQLKNFSSTSEIKVSLLVKELCAAEWITSAPEFISKFYSSLEALKVKNAWRPLFFYKAIQPDDNIQVVEVWKYSAAGDKKFQMFKIYK